jgi:cell division ATPase FtsA
MNEDQAAAARQLAVAYNAYNRAIMGDKDINGKPAADHLGVIVWGEALRIAQTETGIELHDKEILEARIARARAVRQSVKEAVEAAQVKAAAKKRELEVSVAATELGLALLELSIEEGESVSTDELWNARVAVADAKTALAVFEYNQSK